jgi:hypothetical protein
MFNRENGSASKPQHWPPCDRAQADGVPCQELDRDCEKCAKAYPDLQGRDNQNDQEDNHPMQRQRGL